MSALAACLAWSSAHAAFVRTLDDRLGRHHGVGWFELRLLDRLAADPDGVALAQLAVGLHVPASAVLRAVLALEKTGWVDRAGAASSRRVRLRAAGRGLHAVATETAAHVCALALPSAPDVDALERAATTLLARPVLRG